MNLYCADCGIDTFDIKSYEYYSVSMPLWTRACKAKPKISIYKALCIGCLELRIKRELTCDDFGDVLINHFAIIDKRTTQRLANRLRRAPRREQMINSLEKVLAYMKGPEP